MPKNIPLSTLKARLESVDKRQALKMVAFPLFIAAVATSFAFLKGVRSATINAEDPRIWYHGRWDAGRGSWWAGTGLTLHVENLSSLSIQLGPNSTLAAPVGLSVNYAPFTSITLVPGLNTIPLNATAKGSPGALPWHSSVIRLNVEGAADNHIYVQKIIINNGALLRPYTPSPLNFQFIGDSLSSGYLLPNGVDGGWPFLTAEAFKAEQQINAQPGACLTEKECWGNVHGLDYQFFKTEDTTFYYTASHNYTTNWDFRRDYRPTHVFFQAGTNDFSFKTPDAEISKAYVIFLGKLRALYPFQPIFAFDTWGWPNDDGTYGYIYTGILEDAVKQRKATGDRNIYYINPRGWVTRADVYDDLTHPNPTGAINISAKMQEWLKNWGLKPLPAWPTLVY